MTAITSLSHATAIGAALAAMLYSGTVAIVSVIAVAAPTPERRHDARETLKILLRRNPSR